MVRKMSNFSLMMVKNDDFPHGKMMMFPWITNIFFWEWPSQNTEVSHETWWFSIVSCKRLAFRVRLWRGQSALTRWPWVKTSPAWGWATGCPSEVSALPWRFVDEDAGGRDFGAMFEKNAAYWPRKIWPSFEHGDVSHYQRVHPIKIPLNDQLIGFCGTN